MFGAFSILFAVLRQLSLVFSTAVFSTELRDLAPDVLFVDQLSACIPFFQLFYPRAKVLFYGHFPDHLLAKEGTGATKYLKRAYRKPFDAFESWSTGQADRIVVNSKFTRSIFRQAFPSLRSRDLRVVYPCVNTDVNQHGTSDSPFWSTRRVLLSINRYEGKKNLDLAIKAYAGLSAGETSQAKLVIAGGFDVRVRENSITLQQLQRLADSYKLSHATYKGGDNDVESDSNDIVFLLSVPEHLKRRLLQRASLLIYTPENEHFGIVPLEAMLFGVPVLATNTGGPLETIYDGRTGWLRSADKVAQWTEVMRKPLIPSSAENLRAMGQRGRERVIADFGQAKMTALLDQEIQGLAKCTAGRPKLIPISVWIAFLALIIALVAGAMKAVSWWRSKRSATTSWLS